MRTVKMALTTVLVMLLVGCAGIMHNTKDLPDWYLNTPDEETALFGIGESIGDDLGLTRQDAQAAARDEIAQQMEIKISNLIIRSKQMVGGKTNANVVRSTSKQIANLSAVNIKIVERKVIQKSKGYVVYALAKMPIESLKEQTRQTIADQNVQRQLGINTELQNVLNAEIEKMNGLKEN